MMISDQNTATTLQGAAALVNAVAWPLLIGALVVFYRKPIGLILAILVDKVRLADSFEIAGLKIDKAKKEIQDAVEKAPLEPPTDQIPESQVKGAQTLEARLTSAGISSSETASIIEAQVVQFAGEYQIIRSSMPPGQLRTSQMNNVMGKMRTLGIRMLPLLDRMALSRVDGERLAAIAALQVQPDGRYLRWLAERLYVEVPFVFFHAALAISEFVQKWGLPGEVRNEVQSALDTMKKYPAPDQNTIRVLEQILSS